MPNNPPNNTNVTQRLAQFVAETQWDALDAPVVHQAKRALMNFFAVALIGCREGAIETALQSLAGFSVGRQAAVIGRPERLDALSAAFLNAASANVLDFCDTHIPTVIHPTAPVAPALFALGEMSRVRGRDLILAFILGAEIECRIGLAISPSHYRRGWHITATCGVFGAAAGGGKLLALKTEPLVSALGIAATQAAGLCECLGTPAKSVGVGNAARNGLWAALLAAQGFAGPPEPLNGTQGYFHALAEAPQLSILTDELGDGWELMKTAFKPYPCGFVVHPVLDCVIDWRRAHPDAVVEQVTVIDPRVVTLRGKVAVKRDESFATTAAAVEIASADGKVHKLHQRAARGSDDNPMADADLEQKLREAVERVIPHNDVAALIEAIWTVDDCADIAKLTALTVPR